MAVSLLLLILLLIAGNVNATILRCFPYKQPVSGQNTGFRSQTLLSRRHEAAPLGRGPIAGESGLGSEAKDCFVWSNFELIKLYIWNALGQGYLSVYLELFN